MKLHLDKPAFETLLLTEAEATGIRADILEKDYYVTLILQELAAKQGQVQAFFKGGTALYKALSCIRRFSEDIDLTVSVEGCSHSQAKKRIEHAALSYACLVRKIDDPENSNKKGAITSIYGYESVVAVDRQDVLQRFERVKIEATSFTISEPHAPMIIAPVIFEIATDEQKEILQKNYEIGSFPIETIKLERIFIDKVFAAEFYYSRKMYFDTAKHLYDIAVLLKEKRIQASLQNKEWLEYLIELKQREEAQRIGSDLDKKPIHEFSYFLTGMEDKELRDAFMQMQKTYIFEDTYLIALKDLQNGVNQLRELFA